LKKEEDIYKKGDTVGIRGILQRNRFFIEGLKNKKASKKAEIVRKEDQKKLKERLLEKQAQKKRIASEKEESKINAEFYKRNFNGERNTVQGMSRLLKHMKEKHAITYAKDMLQLVKNQRNEKGQSWTNSEKYEILCKTGISATEASKAIIYDNVINTNIKPKDAKKAFIQEKRKMYDIIFKKTPTSQKTTKTITEVIKLFETRNTTTITKIIYNFGIKRGENMSHIEFVSKGLKEVGLRSKAQQEKLLSITFEKQEVKAFLDKNYANRKK
jgi:hypothetical protein